MTQPPHSSSEGLPDLSGSSTPDPDAPIEMSEHSRSRTRTLILTVLGTSVLLIAILALVLSQTVFRSPLDDDPSVAAASTDSTASGHSEYIPDPHDPEIAPPPPLFTQMPSAACTVGTQTSSQNQSPGVVRGGGLEFTIPAGWDYPWLNNDLPYITDASGYGRRVEGNWYSAANVGRVDFPESEGGYPGAKDAAVTIFQCYATTSSLIQEFGDQPQVTDYRSEKITVDGKEGWIVQATYHFDNSDLQTTDQSRVTAIVVDTPGGPSAFISDVAADHPDHVQALDDIIASLKVVG